jgi:hypothetical protein
MMDIQEQISYLYRSGSSADDVECADTMEKLYAVYLAAEGVLPIDLVLISDANHMERLEQAVAAVEEQPLDEPDKLCPKCKSPLWPGQSWCGRCDVDEDQGKAMYIKVRKVKSAVLNEGDYFEAFPEGGEHEPVYGPSIDTLVQYWMDELGLAAEPRTVAPDEQEQP